MRLFFAVPIADEIKEIVSSAVERIPIDGPPWRWISPENYHITIKFLGEVEDRLLPPLIELGTEIAAAAHPFDLSFGPFGSFPSASRPRVLFFAAEHGENELASIAADLEAKLQPLGFDPERRRFRAHLTLARVKSPLPRHMREALASIPPLPNGTRQRVDRIVLMRSTLGRTGASYDEMDSFGLRA